VIDIDELKESEPAGTGRTTARLSFNQVAFVTLSVIPNRFSWRLAGGQPSDVQPLLLYTILNHGQTELDFMLPTNEVLCVDVRPEGEPASWRTSTHTQGGVHQRIVIRLGGVYRQFVAVPPDAAWRPGRYVAHATLCGVAEYGVNADFEVLSAVE
jgi:hypothetical protein